MMPAMNQEKNPIKDDDFPLMPCRFRVIMKPLPAPPIDTATPVEDDETVLTEDRLPEAQGSIADFTKFSMNDSSMAPNYLKGETINIKPFTDGPVIYSSENSEKDTAAIVRKIYEMIAPGSVVALRLNDGPFTCKRLIFRFRGMAREIWLTADQTNFPGYPHCVQGMDKLVIYGKVVARGNLK